MPTVRVRISEQEKKKLMKYGKLSGTLRNAVKLYLDRKESDRVLAKLEKLQRENPVTCTPSEILRSIKEDRGR